MVELVDAPHSKCGTFGFVGSSPTAPTSLMGTYQRYPLVLIKGKGSWVWDKDNNKYLDAVAGIATCSLGHSNKALREALTNQLRKIQHVSNLYNIPEQEALAQWLTDNSCADSVFFCNSGAEANEAAIKLARKHGNINRRIDQPIILTAHKSFHGRTLAALSATGQPKYHKGFGPLLEGFEFFAYNDWESFKKLFNNLERQGPKVAAVLIEPLQGEGGIYPGDKRFFKKVKDLCSKNNVLLIFDEVQTGMGRTGYLWGYEHLGVEPDVFTLAKGLGGGHALGALLSKKHAAIFEIGDHASTFGGNPFACRAGLTVAKEIQKHNLLNNVEKRGDQLKKGLLQIINDFPNQFNEVRGLGLIQGLVIKDESSLTSQEVTKAAIHQKLLVIPAGPKVIRMVPSLTIKSNEVTELLKRLRSSLTSSS